MFEDKTPEAIKESILKRLQSDIDKREGSFVDDMVGPIALELHKMYTTLNAVQPMVWVDETSGIYLDMAAEDIGIEPRKQGTNAIVELLIQGEAGYIIPAETIFLTQENYLFTTVQDCKISDEGIGKVEAKSQEVGSIYNVPANSIIYTYHSDVRIQSVTNAESAKGGSDPESDYSLYQRLKNARQRPATSGNIHHYQMWALEVPGVGVAKVYPLWDGPGTVKVLIADEQRRPVNESIILDCYKHIEKMRPVGAEVTVTSAEAVQVNIFVRLKTLGDVDQDTLLQNITKNITEYFQQIALVQSIVSYNRVGAILINIDGVEDYKDLSLNAQQNDLQMEEGQMPVLGEVDIDWI